MTEAAPPAPPPAPARRIEAEAALRTGWGRGAAAAAVVLLLLYALNVVFAVVQQTSVPDTVELGGETVEVARGSLADVPQAALASVYLWHGAGFEVDAGGLPADVPFPGGLGISLSFALILGTFVVLWSLRLAGRHLVRAAPVPLWLQPVRWLQVALPYSLLSLFLSPLARTGQALPGIPTPGDGGAISAAPSPGSVLAMAFLLSLAAAGAGAMGAAGDRLGAIPRKVVGVLAGGWRMLWLAVALAVLGFLVVAALHPEQTRAYLEFVSTGGVLGIIRGAVLTLFLLGNVGVYVAAAATGTGIGISGLGESCTLLSYTRFPRGGAPSAGGDALTDPCTSFPLDLGPAPLPYLLFLLVPLLATILGGRRASLAARSPTPGEGAALGASASAPFALLFVAFGGLAGLSYEIEAFFRVSISVGPSLIPLFLLAMVWGSLGGALGGWLGAGAAPPEPGVVDGGTGFERDPGTTDGPELRPGPS